MPNEFDELYVKKSVKIGRSAPSSPFESPFWTGVQIDKTAIVVGNINTLDSSQSFVKIDKNGTIKLNGDATKLDVGKISMGGAKPSLWVGGIGIEPRTSTSLPNLLGIHEKNRQYTFEVDPNACKLWMRRPDGANAITIDGDATKLDVGKISMGGAKPSLWVGGIGIEPRTSTSLPNLLGIHEKNRQYTFEVDPNACKLWMRRPDGTNSVTIDGDAGDVILENADCAEDFEISPAEQVEAGSVMVLNNIGQLVKSFLPYDKRVAGVVSGAGDLKPGLVLGRRRGYSDRLPIALIGRANCRVNADYEPIEVGDLLTTSATAGHAMKASDPVRSFGAVIGKALRPLKNGCDLIPILVALQ